MNLDAMLRARAAAGKPIRVGLVGAGKFATMWLAQAGRTPGVHVLGIADLSPGRAHAALAEAGWPPERGQARSPDDALKRGATWITEDAGRLIAAGGVDVVVEATGDPAAGIRHARLACRHGRHVVMVSVEADALAGPLLARQAKAAGVVYSLAYGDQPALIAELVDWARASAFEVTAAGKGTLYMPEFRASTPETVWGHYGLTPGRAKESGLNAKMFNSFLDGTKSAIEMAAVANATGLEPAPDGLAFPPCGTRELAARLVPREAGGVLHHEGQVEVVSSRRRDGRDIDDHLRWGVYVVFEAPCDYVRRCFADYGIATDASGRFAALWRPYHLIGLELGVSVASVALRGEATGAPNAFVADVAAVAKRDLGAGEVLDGEGGHAVWGRLMPAAASLAERALPIGLAHGVELKRSVAGGGLVRFSDVALDESSEAVAVRREMEAAFAPAAPSAARRAAARA
jgi:predicted homoserine dehydrogenase-like protein